MKKNIFLCLITLLLVSCNTQNTKETIPDFFERNNPKYGSDAEFLANNGHPVEALTEIGFWVFDLGTTQRPLINKVIIYWDRNEHIYFILDKFEDGSKGIKPVNITKRGSLYDVVLIEPSNDSYIIDGNNLRLKTKGYYDELIGKGEFYQIPF